jgi:hypothetical protein
MRLLPVCFIAGPAASTASQALPELALASLRLTDPSSAASAPHFTTAPASAGIPPAPGQDASLALRLLPLVAPLLPSSTAALAEPAAAAAQLSAALLHGSGIGSGGAGSSGLAYWQSGGSSSSGSTPFAVRVLQLGYELFLAGEYGPLVGLTRLAQAATASMPKALLARDMGSSQALQAQVCGEQPREGVHGCPVRVRVCVCVWSLCVRACSWTDSHALHKQLAAANLLLWQAICKHDWQGVCHGKYLLDWA